MSILAVDIGTSSVRSMIFKKSGENISSYQIKYNVVYSKNCYEEQDGLLIRDKVYEAIIKCVNQVEKIKVEDIEAIVFSSQMYSLMCIDKNENPITNNIIWSDARAIKYSEKEKIFDISKETYKITGCPVDSMFPRAKISWIKNELKNVFDNTYKFITIKDFVLKPLIGEWVADYSMASASGFFDIKNHKWHKDSIDYLGVAEDKLPSVVSGTECFKLLKNSPISFLGFKEGLKIFLGAGDGPLANIGSGAFQNGDINIDIGTSGAARAISDNSNLKDDDLLWCFCLDDKLWAKGGIIINACNSYNYIASIFSQVSLQTVEEIIKKLDDISLSKKISLDDPITIPYLRKARSPYWDSNIKYTLYGLTPSHTISDIIHSLFISICFDMKTIINMIECSLKTNEKISFTGGLSKSPLIASLLSDVLERNILIKSQREGSIAGAAIMGFYALGVLNKYSFTREQSIIKEYKPRKENKIISKTLYKKYVKLIEIVRNINLDKLER